MGIGVDIVQFNNTMIFLTTIGLVISMVGVATMIYVDAPLTTEEYLESPPPVNGETTYIKGQITDITTNPDASDLGTAIIIQLDGILSFRLSNQVEYIPNGGDIIIIEVSDGIILSWESA